MAGTNPRAARIAALIQRVIASAVENQLHDKRLANVTITEVRVTNDLQIARVYWTQLGREGHERGERQRAKQALEQAKGHLRSLVGAKAGLRLTPQLQFVYDEVPGEAHELEDIIVVARKRDEQLAKARENAQYAGDADPYKHPRVDDNEDADDTDDLDDADDVDDVDDVDDDMDEVGDLRADDSEDDVVYGDEGTGDADSADDGENDGDNGNGVDGDESGTGSITSKDAVNSGTESSTEENAASVDEQ